MKRARKSVGRAGGVSGDLLTANLHAACHFSPALIANLERYWGAQNRSG